MLPNKFLGFIQGCSVVCFPGLPSLVGTACLRFKRSGRSRASAERLTVTLGLSCQGPWGLRKRCHCGVSCTSVSCVWSPLTYLLFGEALNLIWWIQMIAMAARMSLSMLGGNALKMMKNFVYTFLVSTLISPSSSLILLTSGWTKNIMTKWPQHATKLPFINIITGLCGSGMSRRTLLRRSLVCRPGGSHRGASGSFFTRWTTPKYRYLDILVIVWIAQHVLKIMLCMLQILTMGHSPTVSQVCDFLATVWWSVEERVEVFASHLPSHMWYMCWL